MYCYNDDRFCDEIEDIINDFILQDEVENLEDLPEDYILTVECCSPKRIFKLDSKTLKDIMEDMYYDDNHSEDGEEWENIEAILDRFIDFEALNKEIPVLWYPNGKIETYTKAQLIELYK